MEWIKNVTPELIGKFANRINYTNTLKFSPYGKIVGIEEKGNKLIIAPILSMIQVTKDNTVITPEAVHCVDELGQEFAITYDESNCFTLRWPKSSLNAIGVIIEDVPHKQVCFNC